MSMAGRFRRVWLYLYKMGRSYGLAFDEDGWVRLSV